MKNNNIKAPVIFIALVVCAILLSTVLAGLPQESYDELTYSEFLQAASDDKIAQLDLTEYVAVGRYKNSKIPEEAFPARYDFTVDVINSLSTMYEDLDILTARLDGKEADTVSRADYHFELSTSPLPSTPWWITILPYAITLVLLGGFWLYFMRAQQSGNGKMMSFGKSKARVQEGDIPTVTFDMVAGADEEKEELVEIVDFLKHAKKYEDIGARIPKGVLLVGSPGTGKTYLAKAVAGEAKVAFYSISGSDFVEMFVGVGASRVRDLFEQAKKHAPAIVFIDEIDAVGRQRGAGLGGGHDEREQTLNQLLVEMDGFAQHERIIVMAATNRPDILDPALLRPGRFDRQIPVHLPDIKGREAVLKVHGKNKKFAPDVDLREVARLTPYFTPADLENLLNESAILAVRRKKDQITMQEIEDSVTRVMMGPEKKSRVVSELDKKLVAYHEAGHAVVAYMLPNCDKVSEVSIIPRGMAGGYTMTTPSEDVSFISKGKLQDRVAEYMGGRVAEMLKMGDISTGASSDIKEATNIARGMVTQYGMSDVIGTVFLGGEQEVFLGKELGHANNISDQLSAQIDSEIHRIVQEGYDTATRILTEFDDKLEALAKALLEKEKVEFDELVKIMGQLPANKLHWPKEPAEQNDTGETPAETAETPAESVETAAETAENKVESDQNDDSVGA